MAKDGDERCMTGRGRGGSGREPIPGPILITLINFLFNYFGAGRRGAGGALVLRVWSSWSV